jgi:ABC-type arginine transport system permease subunit
VSLTFRPFELYTAAMVIYIILTLAIARIASFLEQRAARSLRIETRRIPRTAPSIRTAA